MNWCCACAGGQVTKNSDSSDDSGVYEKFHCCCMNVASFVECRRLAITVVHLVRPIGYG